LFVDIDFVTEDRGELACQALEDGRDDAARATPSRPKIDCDRGRTINLKIKSELALTRKAKIATDDFVELHQRLNGRDRHVSTGSAGERR
jgi:hypothetical protein